MNREALQVENGNYTRIVNPLIEELIKVPFKGCELAVAMFIIRKTYGYQKKQDSISLTQFENGLNRCRNTVVSGLKNLQELNIIRLVKKGNAGGKSNVWEINKYHNTWLLVQTGELVQRNDQPSATEGLNLVQTGEHTKDNTKENTKERPETSSGLPIKSKKMKKNSFRYREDLTSDTFEDVIDLDTGEKPPAPKKDNISEKYWAMIEWAKKRRGMGFVNVPKQFKAFSLARKNKISPERLKDRWIEMEKDNFWKKNGFDWTSVVSSFDKKQ